MPQNTKELTRDEKNDLVLICSRQLETSRRYKRQRMKDIQESEDLYFGKVTPSIRNPFNEPFPFMSGFIDTLMSKIDDAPNIEFIHKEEADFKAAQKVTAAWETESASVFSNAKWNLKDRWAKKLAIFSGRGIHKIYSENDPEYMSHFDTIDYWDFHSEPHGSGNLEDHLFCGQEGIYRSRYEIELGAKSGLYDRENTLRLIHQSRDEDYKETEVDSSEKENRHRALGLDPQSNNYIGQSVHSLIEWYTEYKGHRYYVLFDETSKIWLRIVPLTDMFPTGLYPYVTWATHEEPRIFWSKAPADDARPIARIINRLLNQELYNREKRNYGTLAYDVDMIDDLEALRSHHPDKVIPVVSKQGKGLKDAVYEFKMGEVGGSVDIIQFLNSFHGEKSGVTPASQGNSENSKKVGIFFGELQQVQDRLNTLNKSYKEAWAELGRRYQQGLDTHLNKRMAIKIMGTKGVEWDTISRKDLQTNREFDIIVSGGSEERQTLELENNKKIAALKAVSTVSNRWRDEQVLRSAGFDDEDIKNAFTMLPMASQELMSEAAQSIQDIIKGRTPKLNRGANAAFMQKIIDEATDLDGISEEVRVKLYDYAIAHAQIAAENEARNAIDFVNRKRLQNGGAPVAGNQGGGIDELSRVDQGNDIVPSEEEFIDNPTGSSISVGSKVTNNIT